MPTSPVPIFAIYMSILRESHVGMAHVMSLIFSPMSIGFMSHVDFKKWSCHHVELRGLGLLRLV